MFSSASATAAGIGSESLGVADMRWGSARGAAEGRASMVPYSGTIGGMPPPCRGSGAVVSATATRPTGHVMFPTADLVDRSAFLFGLLQSDHLVHDVHNAIVALSNVAARDAGNGDAESRTAGGWGGGEGSLSAVFYFPARPPSPDMPWRPIYGGAVLLCVFSTVAAAQRAIVRVDGVVLHRMKTEVRASASAALTGRLSSPYLVLRPAREFVLGPENTETALLTYLTTPRLVDLLLRRQRLQRLYDGVAADDAEQRSAMEAYTRANLPPGYLCGSAARLYAAILSPQSPYAVDWAAARVAISRGDGVVVPEMSVVEPWACGGAGRCSTQKGVSVTAASLPPADGTFLPSTQAADLERRRRANLAGGEGYVPMTLQEEEYYRRYGAGPPIRAGSNRARCGSLERRTEMTPSCSSLSRGKQGVVRGFSWLWRRAYERLGRKGTVLISGLSSLPVPPVDPSVPLQATSGQSAASQQAPLPAPKSDRCGRQDFYEPPRARHRPEGGGPIMIPRYNAVGSALSWLPGFHLVAPLFVTGAFPLGGTAPPLEPQPQQRRRRRMREEDGGLESSVLGEKGAQLYGIAPGDVLGRDNGPYQSKISFHHARMPAPFSDSATWGGASARQWGAVRRPLPPFCATDHTPQTACGGEPRQESRLSTPMISSIAPSPSHTRLHDSSLASCNEKAAASVPRWPYAAGTCDSIATSPQENSDFAPVDGARTAGGGGSSAVDPRRSFPSNTSPAARTRRGNSAIGSGSTKLSGTLADEIRAFGGGDATRPPRQTGDQREVHFTAAVTTAAGDSEKKSSSSASRRTVEFSLPDDAQ